MKIFDKASCSATGNQRPYLWNPVKIEEKTTEISVGNGDFHNQTEYKLEVRISCIFYANQAQYQNARETAEQIISKEFFSDVLKWVSYARRAVMESDGESAIYALGELEKEILG